MVAVTDMESDVRGEKNEDEPSRFEHLQDAVREVRHVKLHRSDVNYTYLM
jgi:hypothetical protein